jgi:hypothetical protein
MFVTGALLTNGDRQDILKWWYADVQWFSITFARFTITPKKLGTWRYLIFLRTGTVLLDVDKCLDCATATSSVGPDPTPESAGQGAPYESPSRSREDLITEQSTRRSFASRRRYKRPHQTCGQFVGSAQKKSATLTINDRPALNS